MRDDPMGATRERLRSVCSRTIFRRRAHDGGAGSSTGPGVPLRDLGIRSGPISGQDLARRPEDVFTVSAAGGQRTQAAVRNAKAEAGSYPLLLFSHHSGGPAPDGHVSLHAPGQPRLRGRGDGSWKSWAADLARREGETEQQKAARVEAVIGSRVPDVRFLLDRLLGGAPYGPGRAAGRLADRDRRAQLRGWTALAATEVEQRICAVVALAPGWGVEAQARDLPATLAFGWGRDVPALYLVAENDTVAASCRDVRDLRRTPATKRRWWCCGAADHMHFMDNVELMHEAVRQMNLPAKLAWLPRQMRPIGRLWGAGAPVRTRPHCCVHMDATLRRQEDAGGSGR